jgi:hypothetical protein
VELNGDILVLIADHVQPADSGTAKSILEWVRVKAGRKPDSDVAGAAEDLACQRQYLDCAGYG